MLLFVLIGGLLAMQTSSSASAEITPEAACGPDYHEFPPPAPVSPHAPKRIFVENILSNEVVVEGTVESKRTYAGSGVQNDVQFRVTKVLKGKGVADGDVITVHVRGGYAPDDRDGEHICRQDTQSDGIRVEVGRSYLLPLTKEAGTPDYRAEDLAGWFRIANNGDLVPLTPALVMNKALAGK